MRCFFLIFTLTVFLRGSFFSQNYSFKTYSHSDGFHSPEAMRVFNDSRGFLWIGCVDGLTRYDGLKFITYTKTDGLIENEIQGISEDKKTNLWIASISGISYFDGKNFINYGYKKIAKPSEKPYFISVHETSNGTIYACSATGLYKLDKNKKEFCQLAEIDTYVSDLIEDKEGTIWIAASLAIYTIKEKVFRKINLDSIIGYNTATCLTFDKNQNLWIGTTKGILKYANKKFVYYFSELKSNHNIKDVIIAEDSSVIFTSATPEIKIYKNGNFKLLNLSNEIGNVDIQNLTIDKEGNYWLAAIGLVKMYTKPFQKHYLSDAINSKINTISGDENSLYFGTDKGLKIVKNNRITTYYPNNYSNEDKTITSLCKVDSFLLAGTHSGSVYKFYKNKFLPFDASSSANDKVNHILQSGKNEFWICKNTTVTHKLNGKASHYTLSENVSAYTQNAFLDSSKNLWLANLESLTIYKNDHLNVLGKKQGFIYKSPVTINQDKNAVIWIGTFGDGLVKYDGKTFKNYSVKNSLVNDYVSASYYDVEENVLWVGTNNGISKLKLDHNSNISSIKNYNSNYGDFNLSCNQNCIYKLKNGHMLFGCKDNLVEYIPSLDQNKKSVIPFYFEGVRLNYEKTNWEPYSKNVNLWSNMPNALILPYDKNHLTFDFTAINFNDSKNINFQWKLLNTEKEWSPESKNNFVTYSNIPPGTYTFSCRVSNSSGVWSKPIAFSFTITPPFYQTTWFTPLLIILLISGAFISSHFQVKKIQMQEALKTENYRQLAEVELKAMRAQMNPHFIFNTLNSIQEVVLNKDDATARIYLSDFALMMRMILENSSQKDISLDSELEFINLYLKLEKLRFEDKFNVTISVSDFIDIHQIKIPPMLLQPYIENAILHGLMHKTKDGVLNISFEMTTINDIEILKCSITDNGVGRKRSKELSAWKGKKHQSMSTEITEERVLLLNNINSNKGYKVIITDLENEQMLAIGTKVEIYIPLK
jgi:ligand-binding sensor domain-containing protein